MKLEHESSQKVDNVDGSTEIDEELLAFFVADSEVERELSRSPDLPCSLSPNDMALMPAIPLGPARFSLKSSNDSSLYIRTAEMHEQTISDQPLKYPMLPSFTPAQTNLQDSTIFQATPSGVGLLQYPILPQPSSALSFNEIDRSCVLQESDFECSFMFTEAQLPPVVNRSASSTVETALTQTGTSKTKDNEKSSGPNLFALRVQSGRYHKSSREGGSRNQVLIKDEDLNGKGTVSGVLLSKLAIYGQNKPADDVLTELYAEDYDLSEIDLAKGTPSQYVSTETQSIKEIEPTSKDGQTAEAVIREKFGQTMAILCENIDGIAKEPPPACKKWYVEGWLAELYAENIDFSETDRTEDIPAYQRGALNRVMKVGGLAVVEADPHGTGEYQNDKPRTFEEDNAFIKFYLGISAEAVFGMNTVPKAATQLPSTPTQIRAVSSIQQRDSPGESLTGLKIRPVHPPHRASLVFRPRQLYVNSSIVQNSSRPKSQLHASSHLYSEPVLFERASPDLDYQTGRDLLSRSQLCMRVPTALAFRPQKSPAIQDAEAKYGVQPLRMSAKLLAHLPKTNTHLNGHTLRHLEWAYSIWYSNSAGTMAEIESKKLQGHACKFDEPGWTAQEWLSIEHKAISNAQWECGV